MPEQAPRGECAVSSGRSGWQVERVELDTGCAGADARAAGKIDEACVFVFGVDDLHVDADVQGAERFELAGERLAAAGTADDDRVEVVARPPVPHHQ